MYNLRTLFTPFYNTKMEKLPAILWLSRGGFTYYVNGNVVHTSPVNNKCGQMDISSKLFGHSLQVHSSGVSHARKHKITPD